MFDDYFYSDALPGNGVGGSGRPRYPVLGPWLQPDTSSRHRVRTVIVREAALDELELEDMQSIPPSIVDLLPDGDADSLCHRLRIGSGIYGTKFRTVVVRCPDIGQWADAGCVILLTMSSAIRVR